MTDIHIDAPFSRRDLLKGGGALIVGFSLAGAAARRRPPRAATSPVRPIRTRSIPGSRSMPTTPRPSISARCELGQGNTTGLLQIAGEELDLDMSQLTAVRLDTNVTPNQGATSSSSSIERGGPQVRAAAAEARQALLRSRRAGSACRSAASSCRRASFRSTARASRSVKYGDLLGDKPFNVKFTGTAPLKPPNRYKLVGTRVPRVDLPDKMSGKYELHAAPARARHAARPRRAAARPARLSAPAPSRSAIDESSIKHIPTARVVRKGDFVGVVAEQEWDAVKAAQALKVTWQETPALPGNADLFDPHARAEDDRHRDRRSRRRREGLRAGGACALARPIAVRIRGTCRSRRTARSPMSAPTAR